MSALTMHYIERLDWSGYICQIHYIHIPITIFIGKYVLKPPKCPKSIIFSENLTIFMTFFWQKVMIMAEK